MAGQGASGADESVQVSVPVVVVVCVCLPVWACVGCKCLVSRPFVVFDGCVFEVVGIVAVRMAEGIGAGVGDSVFLAVVPPILVAPLE